MEMLLDTAETILEKFGSVPSLLHKPKDKKMVDGIENKLYARYRRILQPLKFSVY
ncbi:MAG: hypothetical protein ACHQ1D_02470 [Nitrososphaerales archaeon]